MTTPSDGDEKARKWSKPKATVRRIYLPIPMASVFLSHLECQGRPIINVLVPLQHESTN